MAFALACSSIAFAWTHDSGDKDNETTGTWNGCNDWADYTSCIYTGRYSRWTQDSWQFRGRFQVGIHINTVCGGHAGNCPYYIQKTGGGTRNTWWINQCNDKNWRYYGENNWNGDDEKFWRVELYAWDCAYPNCNSYNEAQAGRAHFYGEKWDYINDWTCLGGYSGVIGDNATGWTESDIYLYPAVDTSHGNVFNYGGKTPGRVQTGDCNNANKLDWKGNAASYGNCDNCYTYAFAWMYSPSGAGPKFLIGADDDQKTWVNGTLISSGTNCCNRDNFETGGTSLSAGWNRILFKVRNGGGGFNGTVSLRSGGDRGWNETSVNRYSSSYGLGYEQDDWYPRIDVSNFEGLSNPQPGNDVFTNDTTINASGTASVTGPVPFWKVMHYEWGYGISETNYADVTSSGTSWSHTQTGVTGHRRFHFFSVSKSKRTSIQNSGISGGSRWADGTGGNYIDVYVDNVAPVNPSFSSASAAGTSQINLSWAIPNDLGVGVGAGSTEDYEEGGTNKYRRGDVGCQVYRNGSVISSWGTGTSKNDTGLTANTAYTYTIEARDNTSQSRGSWANATGQKDSRVVWTLSVAPTAGSVTGDNPSPCAGDNITWTAAGGFGSGKIAKYKYVWDQNATHTWAETEADWSSGTIQTTPTSGGNWYLHVKGYNGANVANGTYDYLVTTGPAPASPTDGTPTPDVTSVTWNWSDISGETGYRVKDTSNVDKSGDLSADTTSWTETTGIDPNTQYTRKIYSYNACGESTGSTGQTKYSLALAPTLGTNLNADKAANTWLKGGTSITFSNPQGFGVNNKVSKFKYVWDTSPSHSWDGSEADWTSGDVVQTPTSTGDYYLHVQSWNGDTSATPATLDHGPFRIDATPPDQAGKVSVTGSSSELTVDWTASADAESGFKEYELWRSNTQTFTPGDVGTTKVYTGSNKTYSDSIGTQDTVRYYKIRSLDNVDNTADTSSQSGRTTVGNKNTWTYSTGATTMSAPGILPLVGVGTTAVFVGSNDHGIHGMSVSAGGRLFDPELTGSAINGRTTPIRDYPLYGLNVPMAFASSLDGKVYALKWDTSTSKYIQAWVTSALADQIKIKPGGKLGVTINSNSHNILVVGTATSNGPNKFVCLDMSDGSVLWQSTPSISNLDEVIGTPVIGGTTAYFTSLPGSSWSSVWAVSLTDGSVLWDRGGVGTLTSSPSLFGSNLYVGNSSGTLYCIDTAGSHDILWQVALAGGAVYGAPWITADGSTAFVSTGAKVHRVNTSDHTVSWSASITQPSSPVMGSGDSAGYVYVGASGGLLYQIDAGTGSSTSYSLGSGAGVLGDPAISAGGSGNELFIGAADGRIYKVTVPF